LRALGFNLYDRNRVIESVPNFSLSGDRVKLAAIVDAAASVRGVVVLGSESDTDHNRSVVTFAGEPEVVTEAAIRAAGKAAELIDLREHVGVHPRVGATDVLPFVPLEGSTMEDCVNAAHRAGLEIWNRFRVPVYFYESAALIPERTRLEKTRRSGFDGRPPDIGDVAAHPTAGAVMVGARQFLIAFNFLLNTREVAVAKAIARKIRESSGGFRYVKAIGLYLASKDCAQIGMNLTNFAETPLDAVYEALSEEAARWGTSVREGEMIGFVPRKAFEEFPEFFRTAPNFDESRIIENRIEALA
jgi:glutamate formiminotransferase